MGSIPFRSMLIGIVPRHRFDARGIVHRGWRIVGYARARGLGAVPVAAARAGPSTEPGIEPGKQDRRGVGASPQQPSTFSTVLTSPRARLMRIAGLVGARAEWHTLRYCSVRDRYGSGSPLSRAPLYADVRRASRRGSADRVWESRYRGASVTDVVHVAARSGGRRRMGDASRSGSRALGRVVMPHSPGFMRRCFPRGMTRRSRTNYIGERWRAAVCWQASACAATDTMPCTGSRGGRRRTLCSRSFSGTRMICWM